MHGSDSGRRVALVTFLACVLVGTLVMDVTQAEQISQSHVAHGSALESPPSAHHAVQRGTHHRSLHG